MRLKKLQAYRFSLLVTIGEWFSRAASWWALTGTWCVCCPSVNTRYPEREAVRWQTLSPWICSSRHVWSHCTSACITRSWVTPDLEQRLKNSRKPSCPSYTTRDPKVMSSRADVGAVIWCSDDVSVLSLHVSSGFTGCPTEVSLPCPCLDSSLCLHVQLHLSGYSAPHLLVVIPSAAFLCLHPNPLMLRDRTPNAFNVALAPCLPPDGWSGSIGSQLQPGWLIAGMHSPHTRHTANPSRRTA